MSAEDPFQCPYCKKTLKDGTYQQIGFHICPFCKKRFRTASKIYTKKIEELTDGEHLLAGSVSHGY